MKPFTFKLQTALDLKLREEDLKKEELHQATVVYKKHLKLLSSLKSRLLEIHDLIRGKQSRKIDISEVRRCHDFIPVLNERIKEQENTTEVSRLEMENVRSHLLVIMKDRKVLEKLRGRHYKEYLLDCLREEQKQVDEMATNMYIHRDSAV